MFKNKKLIIFDMDGTLIDSVPSLANAINYMLKKLGKNEFSEDIIRGWVGNGAQILVKRALVGSRDYKNFTISSELEKEALDIFLNYYGQNLNAKTTLYPGVLKTLKELKARGYLLSVATNKPHQFVGEMLEHFKINTFLDAFIGAGITKHKKPHPQMLLKLCEQFNCPPSLAVMVGDSQNDIISAKNANICSIGLTYGYNYDKSIKEYNPTVVFDNFEDILGVF